MNFIKRFSLLFLFIIAFSASGFSQETTKPDDLEFTEITTPVDSVSKKENSVASKPSKPVSLEVKAPAVDKLEKTTFWGIFISGFIGGLAALLMPCIFPMLPLTVSFFTKGAEKGKAFTKAALYGFFIILIYVILGLLVTVIFGADALNSLSTNGVFNFFFFLLLVIFAASFFGAFFGVAAPA